MKLKPVEWKQIQGDNMAVRCYAFTEIGAELEFSRNPKNKLGNWGVMLDGLYSHGQCETISEGKALAEQAYLKLLLDQLEPDDEAVAPPRTRLDRDLQDSWGSD